MFIEVYINEHLIFKVNDAVSAKGSIYWIVDAGNYVQFDDIVVTAIEGVADEQSSTNDEGESATVEAELTATAAMELVLAEELTATVTAMTVVPTVISSDDSGLYDDFNDSTYDGTL